YAINTVSREMGTAPYVIEVSKGWLNPDILPLLVFFISAFVSFATGTSWGTFAIIIPVSVPLAFAFSGGQVSSLVLATVAASAGGGVFGDHCSPLSDTTVLSSLGSACDHMDHVRTQLPYALVAAAATALIYLALGLF
ncbi:MAG: Na+/H+ antiporter NhaC family protein, partial [Candidatus Aminicenantes bacterium]|nr:Na+/H+ antiporter NhaC family protein [Candidatus Aminicenantes bacterium]